MTYHCSRYGRRIWSADKSSPTAKDKGGDSGSFSCFNRVSVRFDGGGRFVSANQCSTAIKQLKTFQPDVSFKTHCRWMLRRGLFWSLILGSSNGLLRLPDACSGSQKPCVQLRSLSSKTSTSLAGIHSNLFDDWAP